jgi:hypothetical protein
LGMNVCDKLVWCLKNLWLGGISILMMSFTKYFFLDICFFARVR